MTTTSIKIAKNISQLKKIASQYSTLSFMGVNRHILMQNAHVKNNTPIFVDIRKIREYYSILTSSQNCIIGLNNSISRLQELSSQGLVTPLLQECINKSFYKDEWTHSLFHVIFGRTQPPLLTLYLILINAQVQIIRDNTLQWVSFQKLIDGNGGIVVENYIPIRIKIDVPTNTHHVFVSPLSKKYIDYPSFAHPIVMGQLILDESFSTIQSAIFLFYHHKKLLLFNHTLAKMIGEPFPVSQEIFKKSWNKFLSPYLEHIEKPYHTFLIQLLVKLLAPNLV